MRKAQKKDEKKQQTNSKVQKEANGAEAEARQKEPDFPSVPQSRRSRHMENPVLL